MSDTVVRPAIHLLPENISFAEKTLWGESGLFRSIGLASELNIESRKSELALRRTMLTTHQYGGFITMGLMAAAVYFGQRVIDGHFEDRDAHSAFVQATIISYTGTGLLAILSPPPIIRRDEISTITIHKTLAWIHVAGMVLTPLVAPSLRRSSDYSAQAHIHQISAYITFSSFTAAMISLAF